MRDDQEIESEFYTNCHNVDTNHNNWGFFYKFSKIVIELLLDIREQNEEIKKKSLYGNFPGPR